MDEAIASAKNNLDQFKQQKETMDNGKFYIYGLRLVMTGSEIEKLQQAKNVTLVEILDFDNNDIITPLRK